MVWSHSGWTFLALLTLWRGLLADWPTAVFPQWFSVTVPFLSPGPPCNLSLPQPYSQHRPSSPLSQVEKDHILHGTCALSECCDQLRCFLHNSPPEKVVFNIFTKLSSHYLQSSRIVYRHKRKLCPHEQSLGPLPSPWHL